MITVDRWNNLKTGDIICGNTRIKTQQEKFSALLYITTINGYHPSVIQQRKNFEEIELTDLGWRHINVILPRQIIVGTDKSESILHNLKN